MKTQQECIEALENGATLRNPQGFTVYLLNGKQIKSNIKRLNRDYSFDSPHQWSIVPEKHLKRDPEDTMGVSKDALNNPLVMVTEWFCNLINKFKA